MKKEKYILKKLSMSNLPHSVNLLRLSTLLLGPVNEEHEISFSELRSQYKHNKSIIDIIEKIEDELNSLNSSSKKILKNLEFKLGVLQEDYSKRLILDSRKQQILENDKQKTLKKIYNYILTFEQYLKNN